MRRVKGMGLEGTSQEEKAQAGVGLTRLVQPKALGRMNRSLFKFSPLA